MRWPGHNVRTKYKRDFRLVLSAAFFYGCVEGLLFITLAIYVNRESGSLPLVGFITSLPFLAIFIMSFVWGALSDKLGSYKGIIVVGNLITGLMFFPMPFLDIFGLFGLRAVQVFFYSVNLLAVAIVTEMLPRAKGEAAGLVSLFTSAGWLVGGIASGIVYFYGDVIVLFPVCGVMSILTGAVLIPMRRLEKPPAVISLRDTFRLRNRRAIGLVLTIVTLAFVANRAIFTIFPVYLEEVQHLNLIAIGILTASAGLVGAVLVVWIGRMVDKKGRLPFLYIALISYMVTWLVFFLTRNIFLVAIAWCFPSWVFMTISATAMVSDLTTTKERGRGIGALNSAHNLGQFIGAGISGIVAELTVSYLPGLGDYGFRGVFLFATLILLLPLILVTRVRETLGKMDDGVPTGDARSRPPSSPDE